MFWYDFGKMTSATTGTGALTLVAAAAPYRGFDTLLLGVVNFTGTVEVLYEIKEPSTGKWEVGIGSFVTSTLVLTRTLVAASFDGTTTSGIGAAAVNFASGAVDVYFSDAASGQLLAFPGTANNAAALGASTATGILPLNFGRNASSTFSVVASTEYYRAIFWPGTHQIDQACVRSSSATTGNCKLAWYELKQNGQPGAKLKNLTTGTAVGGSGTNTAISVSNFNPPPGWYVEGSIFDAAITFGQFQMVIPSPFGSDSNLALIAGYTRSGNYTTGLPDPAGTSSPTAVGGNPLGSALSGLPTFAYRMAP